MRRGANPLVRYAADFGRSLAEGWDAFWFTPADPTLLGVLRVLTGLMLLYTHGVWGLALADFFGPTGWLDPALVEAMQREDFTYSFWSWIPPGGMGLAHALAMVVLGLFTLGLGTPVTSVLALVVAISYAHRVPAALFGLDQINVMLTLYLAIGPSGRALSVDRWLAGRPAAPSARANLAQRLIQVHMCVIYAFAGISKLQGPAWWDGEAMWLAFANLEYQSADMTWLAWHPWLVNFTTHASLLWEVSFCVLIWRPMWRPLMLAGAVVLHVGIGACLGMWTFGLIMLVGCASFLPNEAVRRLVAGLFPDREAPRPAAAAPSDPPRAAIDRPGHLGAPRTIVLNGNGRGQPRS
ncbi:MAG TPA: HTTM domain-containing protein [Isosphaeraceae bacterium]